MKKRMTRVLSLFLAMLMVLSVSPAAYATADPTVPAETAEATVPMETAEIPEETTAPQEETAAWTETIIGTEPDTTEEATVCTEATEETVPAETGSAETIPEETIPVDTVPPEPLILSESQLAEKRELAESGLLATLQNLIPGVEYGEKEILVQAEDPEAAQQIAAAFSGEVDRMANGIALICLTEQTALEAITAAVDPASPLPAAYPNYYYAPQPKIASAQAANGWWIDLPEKRDWSFWVQECGINDPYLQDPESSNYQWMHDSVNTYAAWGVTMGEPWVKVAVLDTGIEEDHPDLRGKVTSYDIGCGTSDCSGHGTHVAGIIAASVDNGTGGAGIAPGVSIMNIRVFRDAEGAESYDVISGIYRAVNEDAWIINMSLGSFFQNSLEARAVQDAIAAGVTVVAAMGNNCSNSVNYPAAFDGVIAVTALNRAGGRAWFSNYGDWADVAAPGVGIMSTTPGSKYTKMDGTSMASPVVAGVAALYMSAYGYTSPAQMEQLIRSAVSKLDDKTLGKGLINAEELFDGNKAVPDYWIAGEEIDCYNDYDGSWIPCESMLYLMTPAYDNTGKILYTINGRNPAVKNGTVIVGDEYTGPIDLSWYPGEMVTVKAAYVSGMGIVNKVLTLKLKVAASFRVADVRIEGPDTLVAGRSGNFSAWVDPWNADQGVIWSVRQRSSGQQTASVSKTGTLKTVSGKSGYVILRAASAVNSSIYSEIRVNIVTKNPVKSISLNRTTMTLWPEETGNLWASSILDTEGKQLAQDYYGVEWYSGNPDVAWVDSSGVVYGRSKGTATITCKSLDGSGKKATCKVTVVQPVREVWVTGQDKVAPGTTAKYKAEIWPTSANNKKVLWSLENAPYGVSVSSNGTVKVEKYVAEGKTFAVVATAADGSGVVGTYEAMTAKKCTGVAVYYGGSGGEWRAVYNKKGQMTGLTLYSVQRPDGLNNGTNTDTSVRLECEALGTDYWTVMMESSNPEVAGFEWVDDQYVLQAYSAGTTKLTYTADDGSGKKASITVKVINPVSFMSIRPDSGTVLATGDPVIAFGRSANNKVAFADTYGVPTNQKVTWSVAVKEYDSDGYLKTDWTNKALRDRLVSISSSGKLSTKKGLASLGWGGQLRITVTATATDGTGAQTSLDYFALPPTSVLKSEARNWLIWSDGEVWGVTFQCDQPPAYGNLKNCAFTIKSGNPRLVSVKEIACVDAGKGVYVIWLASGSYGAKGSTSLSIKSGDGCKSLTLNIIVEP